MADVNYKVIKDYGTVANHNGVELKLQLISWNGNEAKLDLRAWRNGYAMGGLTMTKDEIETLGILINEQNLRLTVDETEKVKDKTVVEQPKKKRGRPAKVNTEEKKSIIPADVQAKLDALKVAPKKTEEKPKNVIEFPKPKEEIEKLVTEGHATYAECITKIDGFKAIYTDSDSQYVLDGVLELCKVDKDFRNNVMRDDKDFEGALDYMADMCQKGYGYKKGNYGFMDRDMGLGFTIDYFNLKPEPKVEPKKVETKTPNKKGRKRKVV